MDFKERLKLWLQHEGLSPEALSRRIPFGKSQVYNYLNGKSEPGLSFFSAVNEEFPHLNLSWLVAGLGQMLKSPLRESVHQVATGDGHIQVGGSVSGQVVGGRGNKVSTVRGKRTGANCVDLDEVFRVLEDYVSPKVIEEIRERLKAGR